MICMGVRDKDEDEDKGTVIFLTDKDIRNLRKGPQKIPSGQVVLAFTRHENKTMELLQSMCGVTGGTIDEDLLKFIIEEGQKKKKQKEYSHDGKV